AEWPEPVAVSATWSMRAPGVALSSAARHDVYGVRPPIEHVNHACRGIDRDAQPFPEKGVQVGHCELPEKATTCIESFDPMVVLVEDEDGAGGAVSGHVPWNFELPWAAAMATPLRHQRWRCRRDNRGRSELLDAVVPRVGDVDEALRRRRDPFRADELGIAEPGAAEHAEERAETREFVHAVIEVIGHVECAVAVHRDAARTAKGTGAVPERAPRIAKPSALVEVLDSVVAGIDHVERRVGRVDRDADRLVELTRPGPGPAEGRGEGAEDAEHLDPIVPRVADEDVAARVGGDAERVVEVTLPRSEAAPLAGAAAGRGERLDTIGPG